MTHYASDSITSSAEWQPVQNFPLNPITMNAQIIIPARLASIRLPRMLLLAETGKPLIQHTYEAASRTRLPNRLHAGSTAVEYRYSLISVRLPGPKNTPFCTWGDTIGKAVLMLRRTVLMTGMALALASIATLASAQPGGGGFGFGGGMRAAAPRSPGSWRCPRSKPS